VQTASKAHSAKELLGPASVRSEKESYFWGWVDDNGNVSPYDLSVTEKLENVRIGGYGSLKTSIGGHKYELNIDLMEQKNLDTRKKRIVVKASAQWWFRGDAAWYPYPREDALKLALAKLRKEEGVLLHGDNGDRFVNLVRCVQTNVLTHREREIHEGPLAVDDKVKVSAPACKIDHVAKGEAFGSEDCVRDIEDSFICPLSRRIMRDPVMTSVGSTYERQYIEKYLLEHNVDPVTHEELPTKELVDNRSLREAIEEYLADHEESEPQRDDTVATKAATKKRSSWLTRGLRLSAKKSSQ